MALLTTTSDLNPNLKGFYDRVLLERVVAATIYDKFGQIRPLPKNSGSRINFRRYENLANNTNVLNDGVTPTGKKLVTTDINATVQQLGDFVTITDWVSMVGLDSKLMDIAENVLSDQAAQSFDIYCRDKLVAGTNVQYEGAATSTATVDGPLTDTEINAVIRTLESANAKKITEMKVGSQKIGTVPILPAFIGICHPDARYDIENLTGFVPVSEYSQQDEMSKHMGDIIEIGNVKGIRFLATTNGSYTAAGGAAVGATGMKAEDSTNIDVYKTLVLAKNAYGVIPVQKKSIENIVKKMGSAGADDPLNQRGTSGWKLAVACKILNEDFMVRIEHAVTDL